MMKKEKFRYKKEMGQNFIFDPSLIETLADAAKVGKADGVLEIGPGRGTLTTALARRARKVIAVELDRTLIAGLEATMDLYPNVEIVEGDILRADLASLTQRLGTPLRVAANLPYNITTPLIEKLLLSGLPFETIAVMVQKEVGERMMAAPGQDGYGPFSILTQYYTIPAEAVKVPAACFTPRPKVDSVFMLLTVRKEPCVSVLDEALFFRTVRAAFAMRRKTLVNNLTAGFALGREDAASALEAAGIARTARGEALSMEAFARLADALFARRGEKA